MLKPFTFFYLLFLPFLVAGQENSPLKELAQLFNKEKTPVYRIDFIVFKHLEIEEKDKLEPSQEIEEKLKTEKSPSPTENKDNPQK